MKPKTNLIQTFFWCLIVIFVHATSLKAQERIAVLQNPFVLLLDPDNGAIIDPTFIDLTPLSPGTPKAIIQVNEEIWISDQLEDRIDRFGLDGSYLSTISGGLDNIKGMAIINNTEVWVANAGTLGAPGNAIVRFDFDGNNLGFYDTSSSGSSFDFIDTGSEVYISYINTGSRIERRDYSGNVLGNIVDPNIVNFIQQIEVNTTNNSVYAAVFSTLAPNASGLYEFAISDGSILNYWGAQGSLRGVAQLGDGNILISNGSGVHILNTGTGSTTNISAGTSQFFGRLNLSPCTPPPTPTGDANQTFNEGATLADIVIDPITVTWFATELDALANTNPLPNTTVLQDGTTYWAVNIEGDCLSVPFAVTVTVLCNPPSTPTGDANQTFNEGATLADIVIDPITVTWFATELDALANTNPLPNTTVLEDGTTYWAVNIVNDCLSDPFAVTVTLIFLGLDEFSENNIKLFPNPIKNIVTIQSNDIIMEQLAIFDMLGKRIMNFENVGTSYHLDISSLSSGMYLLNVKVNGKILSKKIIKQ
ncbi:MAG: T9SS type A sorting domain-containing protein [Flavobacteriaceae bacterium]